MLLLLCYFACLLLYLIAYCAAWLTETVCDVLVCCLNMVYLYYVYFVCCVCLFMIVSVADCLLWF